VRVIGAASSPPLGQSRVDFLVVDRGADPRGIATASGTGAVFGLDATTGLLSFLAGDPLLVDPSDAALDSHGDLVVVDENAGESARGAVFRAGRASKVVEQAIASGTPFVNPSGVLVGPAGELVVADRDASLRGSNGAVFRVRESTGELTVLSASEELVNPEKIAFDALGNVLVADAGVTCPTATPTAAVPNPTPTSVPGSACIESRVSLTRSVRVIDRTSGITTTLASGGSFVRPSGIDVGPLGLIVVADEDADPSATGTMPGAVIAVDPRNGSQTLIASNADAFDTPRDVAVAPDGSYAVVDRSKRRIYRIDPAGGRISLLSASVDLSQPVAIVAVADRDSDGVPDALDNCPEHANPAQRDLDGDGIGNACDNCQTVLNAAQEDGDGNGIGDVCVAANAAALVACEGAVTQQAGILFAKGLRGLVACSDALLTCKVRAEKGIIGGAVLARCRESAWAKTCEKNLARADELRAKMVATLAGARVCGGLEARELLRTAAGLGFERAAASCAALAPPGAVGDGVDVIDCVLRGVGCLSEEMVTALVPRARALFRDVGLGGRLACTAGASGGDATGAGASGGAILACEATIERLGVKLATTGFGTLSRCAAQLLACRVAGEKGEIAAQAESSCVAKATTRCTRAAGKLVKLRVSGRPWVTAACTALGADDLRSALGFAHLEAGCGALTSSEAIADCVSARAGCASERAVAFVSPRAAELLGDQGLLGSFPCLVAP
jgi:DNA-binding beta-propeller fold protein YncE